jgi:site-specific DNA-cytosine methylase
MHEKDPFAAETFWANLPEVRCIVKPVEEPSVHGHCLSPVDVLTAGLPCRAFSIAGEKKGFDGP